MTRGEQDGHGHRRGRAHARLPRAQRSPAVLDWIDGMRSGLTRRVGAARRRDRAACWRPTWSRPSTCRASIAPRWTAMRVRGEETPARATTTRSRFASWARRCPASRSPAPCAAGAAVRIMTGAPVPAAPTRWCRPSTRAKPRGRDRGDAARRARASTSAARRGHRARHAVLARGRRLRPQDVGALASLGIDQRRRGPAAARAHPRHRQRSDGARRGRRACTRSTTPTRRCCAASSRATAACSRRTCDWATIRDAIREALTAPGADVVLVSGGSSVGTRGPRAAPARRARASSRSTASRCGRRAPRASAASATTLVFLLPGNPVSCLCAYDFFAGRAIRLLGGRPPDWPHPHACSAVVARKIVSAIGRVDYCRVRLRRRRGRAARAQRRVDPVLDDARRRLRDRAGRQRGLRRPAAKSPCTSTTDRRSMADNFARQRTGGRRRQTQFLDVITATRRPRASASTCGSRRWAPRRCRWPTRWAACSREDVVADVDVPGFDRSNVDGFAVQASDTFGAMEEDAAPRCALNDEVLAPGVVPRRGGRAGRATPIATGGDAAARRRRRRDGRAHRSRRPTDGTRAVEIRRARSRRARTSATPAPTSPAARRCCAPGSVLTSRETGVLAALGVAQVAVFRRPRVAIFSTGDEIVRARRAAAARRRLRLQRRDPRRRRGRARRRAGAPRRRSATTSGARRRARARRCERDVVLLLGRHVEGRGRPLVPRRGRLGDPGHRRARRRAQARQADLPRGHRGQARRHPARVSRPRRSSRSTSSSRR